MNGKPAENRTEVDFTETLDIGFITHRLPCLLHSKKYKPSLTSLLGNWEHHNFSYKHSKDKR